MLSRERAAGTSRGLCALLRPGLPKPGISADRGRVGGFDSGALAHGIALAVFACSTAAAPPPSGRSDFVRFRRRRVARRHGFARRSILPRACDRRRRASGPSSSRRRRRSSSWRGRLPSSTSSQARGHRVLRRAPGAGRAPSLRCKHAEGLTAANVTSSTIESLGIFGGPRSEGLLLAATGEEVVRRRGGGVPSLRTSHRPRACRRAARARERRS